MAEFYRQRGGGEAEARLWSRVAETLDQLNLPPALRALTQFNLACYYAGSGHAAQALDALHEVVQLDPSLRENARQDPDLQPVRAHAAYRALVAGGSHPEA